MFSFEGEPNCALSSHLRRPSEGAATPDYAIFPFHVFLPVIVIPETSLSRTNTFTFPPLCFSLHPRFASPSPSLHLFLHPSHQSPFTLSITLLSSFASTCLRRSLHPFLHSLFTLSSPSITAPFFHPPFLGMRSHLFEISFFGKQFDNTNMK